MLFSVEFRLFIQNIRLKCVKVGLQLYVKVHMKIIVFICLSIQLHSEYQQQSLIETDVRRSHFYFTFSLQLTTNNKQRKNKLNKQQRAKRKKTTRFVLYVSYCPIRQNINNYIVIMSFSTSYVLLLEQCTMWINGKRAAFERIKTKGKVLCGNDERLPLRLCCIGI